MQHYLEQHEIHSGVRIAPEPAKAGRGGGQQRARGVGDVAVAEVEVLQGAGRRK